MYDLLIKGGILRPDSTVLPELRGTMLTTSLLTPRTTIKSGLVIPAEPVAWPQSAI